MSYKPFYHNRDQPTQRQRLSRRLLLLTSNKDKSTEWKKMISRDHWDRQRLDGLHLAISVHNCANFTALFKNPYLPWRLIFYYGRGCVDIFWNYTSSNSVKAWGRGCPIFRKNSKKILFFSFPYRCALTRTFHRKSSHNKGCKDRLWRSIFSADFAWNCIFLDYQCHYNRSWWIYRWSKTSTIPCKNRR